MGGGIAEIAGNDTIMLSMLSSTDLSSGPTSIQLERQGYNDYRYLMWMPVAELASAIRTFDADNTVQLEHIYDY